ncbi:MAG: hypothetical protein ACREFP_16740, partial [Acetobacteraceae bacterium]
MPTVTDIGDLAARLRVIDEFTAPIRAALDQIAELQAAVERFKGAGSGVSTSFTRLGTAIARAQGPLDAMAARLDALDAPINAAADRLSAVQDRTAAIAAESAAAARNFASIGRVRLPRAPAAAGGGGARGGGRGGGRHGGGFLSGAGSAAEGAGFGFTSRALSIPGLAVGFATFESLKSAMNENLALQQTMEALHLQTLPAKQQAADTAALRELVRKSAIGTIYTQQETAAAMVTAAQMSGFTGPKGLKELAAIFPTALRMSEVASMQGLGSIQSNMAAALGFAHLITA